MCVNVCVLQSQTEWNQTKVLILFHLGIASMYILCFLRSRQLITSPIVPLCMLWLQWEKYVPDWHALPKEKRSFLHSRGCSFNELLLSLSIIFHCPPTGVSCTINMTLPWPSRDSWGKCWRSMNVDSRQCMEGEGQLSWQRIFELISPCCTETESHSYPLPVWENVHNGGCIAAFHTRHKKKIRSHQLAGRPCL